MPIAYQLTTLSNGLRVVSIPMNVKSVVVGTWAKVGSRYEKPEENGLTHFLEHMFFKGTKTKNPFQIADGVEFVGGHINASTGREGTRYFVKVMGEDLPQGFNTVADMIRNPAFPQNELDTERPVVIEEIKGSLDDPGDYLSDRLMATCFAGQSLGRPILGPPEVIQSVSRQDLFNYVARHYTPNRLVVAAAGDVEHNRLVDLADKAYGDMKPSFDAVDFAPATYTSGDARVEKDMEQIQIYTAFKGVGDGHADQAAYRVLAQILGGGMSSPLFQEIREKRGLVYGVSSFSQSYADAGVFAVWGGLSPEHMPEYLDALANTLRTSIGTITERDLQKAKNGFVTGTAFGLESPYNQAERAATLLLNTGKVRTVDEALADIRAVTLDDLRRVHAEIFSTKPTLAAIGKLDHLESYDAFAARFSPARFARVSDALPVVAPAL